MLCQIALQNGYTSFYSHQHWRSVEVFSLNPSHPLCACSVPSVIWLCDPRDCSPPGSSVHEILQARILERVAMLSSRGSSQFRGWIHILHWQVGSLPLAPPGKPSNPLAVSKFLIFVSPKFLIVQWIFWFAYFWLWMIQVFIKWPIHSKVDAPRIKKGWVTLVSKFPSHTWICFLG